MIILLDNGHGVNTLGKFSPDGLFREYRYARQVTALIQQQLKAQGYDARILVPEQGDVALTERAARVNAVCDQYGRKNVLLVSVHNDAAGADGKWHDARGLSVRVSPQASAESLRLARCIYDAGARIGGKTVTGNRCVPPGRYWPQSLYILNATKCPAVLTENLFQDNREDVAWLMSPEGLATVARYHVEGIKAYIREVQG